MIKLITLALIVFSFPAFASPFDPMAGRNEMMDPSAAAKRWGNIKFDIEKFKTGSLDLRSKMAADLVSSRPFVGMTNEEVKGKLGAFTGYYWSHRFPAYLIEEGWKEHKDSWQLVFLVNRENKVVDVKIHKNCCYTSGAQSERMPSDKQ